MPKIDHDTKEKILAAAEKVFHAYGFKGARTSLIAEEAGISRTMLHYYFSTKEHLFQEVLQQTLGTVISHLKKLLLSEKHLEEVIQSLVETILDLLDAKPGLPQFIFNIINTNPELLLFLPMTAEDNLPHLLNELIEGEKARGKVNPDLNGEELVLDIYALCAMPYLAAPYIQVRENRDPVAMQIFYQSRRSKVLNFVLKGIRP